MCPRPFLNGYRCRKRLKPLSTFPGSYQYGPPAARVEVVRTSERWKVEPQTDTAAALNYSYESLSYRLTDKIMSPFEYAGPLSELIVLGDIAMMHPGDKLLWDSKNMKITNHEAANKDMFMRRLAPRDDKNWI